MRKEKIQHEEDGKTYLNLASDEHRKYKITEKDRLDQLITDDAKPMAELLRRIHADAHQKLPYKSVLHIKKMIKEFVPVITRISKKNIKDSKTLYQIAQEYNLDLKKLIYTSKDVGFPMSHSSNGRSRNFIEGDKMPLFLQMLPEIKFMWRAQENRGDWINALKKMGLSKSYVSKLMSRRIATGKVPVWLFDLFPPTTTLIRNIVGNEQLKDLFEFNFDIMTSSNCKKRIKQTIRNFLGSKRGLLK